MDCKQLSILHTLCRQFQQFWLVCRMIILPSILSLTSLIVFWKREMNQCSWLSQLTSSFLKDGRSIRTSTCKYYKNNQLKNLLKWWRFTVRHNFLLDRYEALKDLLNNWPPLSLLPPLPPNFPTLPDLPPSISDGASLGLFTTVSFYIINSLKVASSRSVYLRFSEDVWPYKNLAYICRTIKCYVTLYCRGTTQTMAYFELTAVSQTTHSLVTLSNGVASLKLCRSIYIFGKAANLTVTRFKEQTV